MKDFQGIDLFEPGGDQFIVDAVLRVSDREYSSVVGRMGVYFGRLLEVYRGRQTEELYLKILQKAIEQVKISPPSRIKSPYQLRYSLDDTDLFEDLFFEHRFGSIDTLEKIYDLDCVPMTSKQASDLEAAQKRLERVRFIKLMTNAGISDFAIKYSKEKRQVRITYGRNYIKPFQIINL